MHALLWFGTMSERYSFAKHGMLLTLVMFAGTITLCLLVLNAVYVEAQLLQQCLKVYCTWKHSVSVCPVQLVVPVYLASVLEVN